MNEIILIQLYDNYYEFIKLMEPLINEPVKFLLVVLFSVIILNFLIIIIMELIKIIINLIINFIYEKKFHKSYEKIIYYLSYDHSINDLSHKDKETLNIACNNYLKLIKRQNKFKRLQNKIFKIKTCD